MSHKKSSLILSTAIISIMAASSFAIIAEDVNTPTKKMSKGDLMIEKMKADQEQRDKEKAEASKKTASKDLEAIKPSGEKQYEHKKGSKWKKPAAQPSLKGSESQEKGVVYGSGATSSGAKHNQFNTPDTEKRRFFVPKTGHHMGPKEHSGVQELTKGAPKAEKPALQEVKPMVVEGTHDQHLLQANKKMSQDKPALKKVEPMVVEGTPDQHLLQAEKKKSQEKPALQEVKPMVMEETHDQHLLQADKKMTQEKPPVVVAPAKMAELPAAPDTRIQDQAKKVAEATKQMTGSATGAAPHLAKPKTLETIDARPMMKAELEAPASKIPTAPPPPPAMAKS
jgi:hypothetical protein